MAECLADHGKQRTCLRCPGASSCGKPRNVHSLPLSYEVFAALARGRKWGGMLVSYDSQISFVATERLAKLFSCACG
jgi:hypothetical protein